MLIRITTKLNESLSDDYGTDSDVYVKVIYGNSNNTEASSTESTGWFLLEKYNYDDFANGTETWYNIPCQTRIIKQITLRVDGSDEWTPESIRIGEDDYECTFGGLKDYMNGHVTIECIFK